MKKLVYIISVFLTGMFLTMNRANAMFGDFTPLVPIAPQLSPVGLPTSIVVVVKYIKQAKQIKDTLVQYKDVTKIKQLFSKYLSKLGAGLFSSIRQSAAARKKVVSYSRTIQESSIADIHSEDSVRDAFQELFLEYPSDKEHVKLAYRDKGDQFKIDTTLEMFISAKEMAKELYGEDGATDIEKVGMIELVNRFENCLQNNEGCDELEIETCDTGEENSAEGRSSDDTSGGSGDGGEEEEGEEDNVCFWNNALKVVRIYNKLMRYNEYLTAMQAQYRAAMGIDDIAKIKEYEKEEEQKDSSAADYIPQENNYAYLEMSTEVMSADILSGAKSLLGGILEDMTSVGGFPDVLDDKGEDLASMEEISRINKDLADAKNAHNMKQMLPEYKKTFEEQKSVHEYHQKTIEYVDIAKKCANSSLGSSDDTFTDYVKALSVQAKIENATSDEDVYSTSDSSQEKEAENSGGSYVNIDGERYILRPVSEEEGSGVYATPEDGEGGDTLPSLDETKKEGNSKADSDSDQYSRDQKGDEQVKAEARVDDLLNWTLGSEFVKGHGGGKPILWHDQKEFYDQYIDGKYDNMKSYVKDVPLMDAIAPISHAVNNIYPYYKKEIEETEKKIAQIEAHISSLWSSYYAADDEDKDYWRGLISAAEAELQAAKDELQMWKDKRDDFRAKMSAKITDLGNTLAKFETPEKKIETLLSDEEQLFANLLETHEKTMADLEKKKEELFVTLDTLGVQLDELNKKRNELKQTIGQTDQLADRILESLDFGKILYKLLGRVVDLAKSPQNKAFAAQKEDETIKKLKAAAELAKLPLPLSLQIQIKQAQKALKQVKEDMEEERKAFVLRNSDAENDSRINTEMIIQDFKASIPTGVIESAMGYIPAGHFLPAGGRPAIFYAGELMRCVQTYAADKIDEARLKIKPYRDPNNKSVYEDIYYASNAEKTLQPIHKELIDEFMHVSASRLKSEGCGIISALEALNGGNAEVFVGSLRDVFTNVCNEVSCYSPDKNYFVGMVPLKADFSMPKEPVKFSSAPLREVFHFDVVDYHNVDKYYKKKKLDSNDDVQISRYSFLNSGLDLPEIWRYILKRHAFVQKEIDLAKLMGEEGNPAFLGSGVYPCQLEYGNQAYEISPIRKPKTKTFKYLVKTGPTPKHKCTDSKWCLGKGICCEEALLKYSEAKKCRNIVLEFDKGAYNPEGYGPHKPKSLIDLEVGGSGLNWVLWLNGSPNPVEDYEIGDSRYEKEFNVYSELGTILAYIPNAKDLAKKQIEAFLKNEEVNMKLVRYELTFNDDLQRAVYIQENTKNVGKNKKDDALLYLVRRALLDKDVFGSYLDFMEIEAVAEDTEKKADLQVEKVREDLRKIFLGTGFDISDEFNMLNAEDYNGAATVLDGMKKAALDKVKAGLAKIKGKTGNVKAKVDDINHAIKVMELDKDEDVHIDGSEDFIELGEKIVKQKANKAVEGEYGKEGDAEFNRQRENIRPPYCPVYRMYQ